MGQDRSQTTSITRSLQGNDSYNHSSVVKYFRSLEDTLEMTEDGNFPAVGSCFEELAEGEEFDVYDKFMQV